MPGFLYVFFHVMGRAGFCGITKEGPVSVYAFQYSVIGEGNIPTKGNLQAIDE
jgi:hypothetical protein